MVAKMYGPQFQAPRKIDTLQQPAAQPVKQQPLSGRTEFQKLLEKKTAAVDGGINFSAHATKRLQQRSLELSTDEVERLTTAVDRAADKGARESLVLLNGMAFVVSVTNRTVITAMDSDQMKENVVTHIDSAVLA